MNIDPLNLAGDIIPYGNTGINIVSNVIGRTQKGTAHNQVHAKIKKLFYVYGTGTPGASDFNVAQKAAGLFNIKTGQWYAGYRMPEVLAIYEKEKGRELEAAARKKGERTTGIVELTTKVISPTEFNGLMSVDGIKFDKNLDYLEAPTFNYTQSSIPSKPITGSDAENANPRTGLVLVVLGLALAVYISSGGKL